MLPAAGSGGRAAAPGGEPRALSDWEPADTWDQAVEHGAKPGPAAGAKLPAQSVRGPGAHLVTVKPAAAGVVPAGPAALVASSGSGLGVSPCDRVPRVADKDRPVDVSAWTLVKL